MLAGLKELRRLKMYLDLVRATADTFQDTGSVFAQALPSLREIMIWDNVRNCYAFHTVDGCVRGMQCTRRVGIK